MAAASSVSSTSNLDVNAIVTQLMVVERQPIEKLNLREASYQAKLSAFGTLKGAVSAFETAVRGLNSTAKFQSLKATPADTSVYTASASSIAVAGSYNIEVTSLAQSQKLIANGVASSSAAIGGSTATTLTFDFGTITGNTFDAATGKYGAVLSGAATTNGDPNITVASTANLAVGAAVSGTGIPAGATIASITDATHFVLSANATETNDPVDINVGATYTSNGAGTKILTIDSSNNTLQGIRDAINAAKMGVTATIVNDGGATPYRLALSSNQTGVTNSMKLTVDGDASIKALLEHDPAGVQKLSETMTASNANLKVDGVAVSKTSNTVADVVQGVTLNLLKVSTAPVKLTVARDTAAISTSVGGFVKAYNDLAKTLQDLSAYNTETKKGAILQGDSTVRNLQAQLRGILGSAATGEATAALHTLSDIGVSFQKDGSLALDQTKLDAAVAENFEGIAALFTSANGYVTKLESWTKSILSTDGALTTRTEGIGRTIADIGRQRSVIEKRLISVEQNYRRQFTSLDVLLSSMNQTSMYLTQQLNQINSNN